MTFERSTLFEKLSLFSGEYSYQFFGFGDETDYQKAVLTRFRGLTTENGITRWLALHVTNDLLSVELGDITVGHILHG